MSQKGVATRPRQIIPGRTVFVTGRAIDRQFRFVPDEETVHTIRYCLGLVLREYGVKLHAFVWMSNHYHLVLTDVHGELPDFMRDLNSKISRALNANRGIRGQNFARESYNLVVTADTDAVLRHCAYTEANPCKAHLVEQAQAWEGVSSAGMDFGDTQTVLRPDFGLWGEVESRDDMDRTRASFRGSSDAPEMVRIHLERPPWMTEAAGQSFRKEIQALVQEAESEAAMEREAEGRRVVGMEAVRDRHYKDTAQSLEQYFQSEPRFSGSNPDVRSVLKEAYRNFVHLYRQARKAFLEDRNAEFPSGTWWMVRHLDVEYACGPP